MSKGSLISIIVITTLLLGAGFSGGVAAEHSDGELNETVEADALVGTESVCAGASDPCWQSFQDALDFLDDGDTLFLLHGGVFEESVVIENDDVRIIGDGDVDTGVFWQPTDAPSGEPTLTITGDGVTLEQFGVDRAGHQDRTSESPAAAAIEVQGTDVTFDDVTVNGFVREWDETVLMGDSEQPSAGTQHTSSEGIAGMYLSSSGQNAEFENTEFEGFDTGLEVGPHSEITMNRVALTNNRIGADIDESSTATITDTALVNNSEFAVVVPTGQDGNETVTATNNWWGSPSGPSGAGPGSGDAVSAGVEYEPWSETAPTAVTADIRPLAVANADLPETVTVEVNARGTAAVELGNIPEEWTVTGIETESTLSNDPLTEYTPGDETVSVEFDRTARHKIAFDVEVNPGLVTLERDLTVAAISEAETVRETAVALSLTETDIDYTVTRRGEPTEATILVDVDDADDIAMDNLPASLIVDDFRYPNAVGEPMARYEPGDDLFATPFGFRGSHLGVTFDVRSTAVESGDPYEINAHEFQLRAGVGGVTTAETDVAVAFSGGAGRLGAYATETGTIETEGLRSGIEAWRDSTIDTNQLRTLIEYWRSGDAVGTLTVSDQQPNATTVTVEEAVYGGSEWGIVVHQLDEDGERGDVLGVSDQFTAGNTVENGVIELQEPVSENTQVSVTLYTPGSEGEYLDTEAAWLTIGDEPLTQTVVINTD